MYSFFYDNLNRLTPYRNMLKEVCNEINHGEGTIVLDAGCGTGNLCELLSMNPSIKLVGIDASKSMLQIARTKLRNNMNVTLKNADLNSPLEFENESFNCVVLTNVLYALRNPLQVLEEIHRILKLGGKLIIVNPVYNPKILKIYYEHCTLNPNLVSEITLFFNLLVVGLLNAIIVKKGKQKQFYFLKGEELVDILRQKDFKKINTRLTYSEQALIVTAIKGDLYFYSMDHDMRETIQKIDTKRCPITPLIGKYTAFLPPNY